MFRFSTKAGEAQVLEVSESGYSAWRKREPSPRQVENERLTEQIAQAFLRGRGVYGSPRVHADLQAEADQLWQKSSRALDAASWLARCPEATVRAHHR